MISVYRHVSLICTCNYGLAFAMILIYIYKSICKSGSTLSPHIHTIDIEA